MIEDTLTKCKYYRDIRLWPLSDEFNYDQWLANFQEGEERDIAMRILEFFTYFPDAIINQMLITVIGKCGYFLKSYKPDWTHDMFKSDCYYSYIPGEDPNPTDSGHIFARKLRDVVGIPESQLFEFQPLLSKIKQEHNKIIILVDDFVGSGNQVFEAWNNSADEFTALSLKELVEQNGHTVIYAPLIVNYPGFNNISDNCKGLHMAYIHLLGMESNIFNESCPCWEGSKDLFERGMAVLTRINERLHIPNTGGDKVIDAKGFHEQGLALSFAHGMPDACPPFFYWETETWKPLVKKVYQRP